MLTHEQIWTAIDRLAARTGLSPSGLARRSGLDPTTFNKSKRVTSDGRPRWPSTESVAKALAATGSSLGSFLDVIANGVGPIRPLPLLNFTDAATRGHFDEDGRPPDRARRDKALPEKKVWRDVALPSATSDEHAYALEISGDDHKPVYRDGDVIVVSPAAPIRRGDRVVVKIANGELTIATLRRRTAKAIELQPLNPAHRNRSLAASDVTWMARIIWASQ